MNRFIVLTDLSPSIVYQEYTNQIQVYISKGLSSLQSWILHVENKFSSSIFDSSHLFEEEKCIFMCLLS
ncbi:hypothetical protein CDAR_597491 [Caerostris darwini]|uniref:Uncharacterized protein n=1 Tax=Caerostris darwini TaxID=1538125 RepID=A0AAV4TY81_9ARAC|nr:hypothetical protein CDAR_597491 [Caerostris darwini]